VTSLVATQLCLTQDKKGCKDSPLISRFPGSVITACGGKTDKTFDFSLPGASSRTVEGEYYYLEYRSPETASNPQIERNMSTTLRKAGYTMVFEAQFHDKFVGHMGKTWIQVDLDSSRPGFKWK
jgi:hypothetical protein